MDKRPLGKPRILVVEDERLIAEDVKMRLESMGYEVTAIVSNGEEALRQAAVTQPDLVLMDIVLHGEMDGIETSKALKARFDTPVVYLTSHTDDETLNRVKLTEPYGYVVKPFVDKELQGVIETALYKSQMEFALKQREMWLATTLGSIGDAVIATDAEGRISFMNPVAERLTGWPQDETERRAAHEIFETRTEGKRRGKDPVEQILNDEIPDFSQPTFLVRRNGEELPVEVTGSPIRSGTGQTQGAVLVFRDISKRLESDQALKESQANLEALIENTTDLIWSIDRQYALLTYNERFAAVIKKAYSHRVQIGDSFLKIVPLERLKIWTLWIDKALKHGAFKVEVDDLLPFGPGIAEISFNPIRQRRKVTGVSIFVHDITKRKQALQDLENSEERFVSIFQSAGDGILYIDKKGNVLEANEAFSLITGMPNQEVVGRNATDLVAHFAPKTSKVNVTKKIKAFLTGDPIAPYVVEYNQRYLELSSPRGMTRGGITAIVRDVTERLQASEALEAERRLLAQRVEERTEELSAANAELARAVRLKDEFLASMSHELRTPLNAILGMSEALQDEIYGRVNDKQKQSLLTVEESGRHLLSLINDILDVSKIEAGKLEFQMGFVGTASVVDASLALIKQAAQKKQLKLHRSLDAQVELIQADERRLKQILVNLLSNAVKFTPVGGEIGLEVTGEPATDRVHFTVWDTGIGIAAADMSKLFKAFVQLDSRLSREHAGTGLGLALVRRLTELHGGGVRVESESGSGSRFIVTLPWSAQRQHDLLERQEPVKPIAERKPGRLKQSGIILLAEDNEENIRTFTGYLEAYGYTLLVARNGTEAVERVRERRPDLILMDIQMPGMDGLAAIALIRSESRYSRIPIIAVTALAMPGDRERCLKAGANDYLSKPVGLKQLLHSVQYHLNTVSIDSVKRV